MKNGSWRSSLTVFGMLIGLSAALAGGEARAQVADPAIFAGTIDKTITPVVGAREDADGKSRLLSGTALDNLTGRFTSGTWTWTQKQGLVIQQNDRTVARMSNVAATADGKHIWAHFLSSDGAQQLDAAITVDGSQAHAVLFVTLVDSDAITTLLADVTLKVDTAPAGGGTGGGLGG